MISRVGITELLFKLIVALTEMCAPHWAHSPCGSKTGGSLSG